MSCGKSAYSTDRVKAVNSSVSSSNAIEGPGRTPLRKAHTAVDRRAHAGVAPESGVFRKVCDDLRVRDVGMRIEWPAENSAGMPPITLGTLRFAGDCLTKVFTAGERQRQMASGNADFHLDMIVGQFLRTQRKGET
jgi:hypothetical protein